jgi:hypothetical protein
MARAFMYQWARRTWLPRVDAYEGKLIPYSASDQFASSGIQPGDNLYVVGFTDERELLLIARFMAAGRGDLLPGTRPDDPCFTRDEALQLLGSEPHGVPLYDGDRYLLPRPGTASDMSFQREIPREPRLRFRTPSGGTRYLVRDPDGRVNPQTVRSMSRLHARTAEGLESLIDVEQP